MTHMIRTMYYVGTLKTQITIFLIARLIDFQCAASNAASNAARARRFDAIGIALLELMNSTQAAVETR